MKTYANAKFAIKLLVGKDNGNGTFECQYFEGANKSTLNLTQSEIKELANNLNQ